MTTAGQALALACVAMLSCGGTISTRPASASHDPSGFHLIAEGPCARLSVTRLGQRTFLVFGDTGYELGDWNAGEPLAAAQSLVEIRQGRAFRNLTLMQGLPLDDGGYVPGELLLGGSFPQDAWLLRTTTRYAPHKAGSLFEREQEAYEWRGNGWERHASADVVRFPRAARSLPVLPSDSLCTPYGQNQRFVRTSSFVLERTGDVWIAGRCQDDNHINTRPTRIRVAHGAPGGTSWAISDAPASAQLDAIVNIGVYAGAPDDVWLWAWEPFKPIERRVPYLAHYEGKRWAVQHPPMTTGVTSVSGTEDGTLWATAGYQLWRRPSNAAWEAVVLPALRFAAGETGSKVRITDVHAFGRDEVWVEGAYRVALPGPKTGREKAARAAVLYSNAPLRSLLYCDARQTADKAIVAVEP